MTSTHRVGQFTWRELVTSEVGKAKSFYGELFNWSFAPMTLPSGTYLVVKHGDRAIGGITPRSGSMPIANAWSSYVSVEDVDAAIEATREHGGLVYAPPQDVPGVGRFAVVADPSGAVISIIRTTNGDEPAVFPPPTSDFAWETLMTTDEEDAIAFYRGVFGWEATPSPSSPNLSVFTTKSGPVADIQPVAAPLPSTWATYVAVASLEDARIRAVRLGANVLNPRIEVPKIGFVSPIIDPTGAQICLFEPLPG